ncbi:transposase [Haloarcula mannanilytica]|uniref:transposase n=1 Tax=Haloarcula mannanilytica TaxID=2509225 RepID=UPI0010F59569|nr:transposase [Haloarcula mannanilytica]
MPTPRTGVAVDALVEQAEELCTLHDHITRVIAALDVSKGSFSDQYGRTSTTDFAFESVVRMFLYQHARRFNDSELHRRLKGTAYVHIRFELGRAPTQQAINYMWRRRFSLADRQAIEATAREIRAVAADHDIVSDGEPRLDPDEVSDEGVTDEHIMQAIRTARDRGLGAFETDRAANAQYPDDLFFERQAYLNLADVGTTTPRRRFDRLSDWDKTPHGDTHLRTMKQIAAPAQQTSLTDYADGERPLDWRRIRDEILEPFHAGLECLLEELDATDGLAEPVIAAVDITHWEFYPSPYKDDDDVKPDDDVVIVNSEKKVPKEEFPEMVSGDKEGRSYKFATLTIIGQDTPIVLGIEPVREASAWEGDASQVDSHSKADIVRRLLEQASQHVEIHKLFADREFDAMEVRDVIDRRNITYLIPRPVYAADLDHIENIEAHPLADVAVERAVTLSVDDRTHDLSFMYVPSTEEDGKYAVFTTNRDVTPDQAMGLTAQYSHRWQIESEYKTIKHHFLPTAASTDYCVRLLYFVLGVVMYNIWRLTNLLLREAVSSNLGAKPPLRAGEVVELVGFCLVPPD